MNVYVTEGLGSQVSYFANGHVHYGQDLERAVGIAAIPSLVLSVKRLLNKTSEKVGRSESGDVVGALLSAGAVFGGLHDTSWMGDYVKYVTYFMIADGLVGGVAPKLLTKLWGSEVDDQETLILIQSTGLCLLSAGIIQYCLLNDKWLNFSIGLSLIPHFLQLVDILYITKEAETFGLNQNMLYFWAIFYAVVSATLAL